MLRSEPRTRRVPIKLTDSEDRQLAALARAAGTTKSEVMRRCTFHAWPAGTGWDDVLYLRIIGAAERAALERAREEA